MAPWDRLTLAAQLLGYCDEENRRVVHIDLYLLLALTYIMRAMADGAYDEERFDTAHAQIEEGSFFQRGWRTRDALLSC